MINQRGVTLVFTAKMNMGMLTHPHTPNQFYASNY